MALRYWVGGTGTWDASNTTNWSATSGGAGGASVPTTADLVTFNSSSGGGTVTLGLDVPCLGIDVRTFTGTIACSTYVINASRNGGVVLQQDGTATVTGTKTVNLNYSGSTGTRTISITSATEANALNVNVTAGTDIVTTNAGCVIRNLNFTGFAGSYANTTRTMYGNLTISSGMTITAGTNATTFAATSGTQQITTNGKTIDFPLTFNGVGGTFQLQDNLTVGSTRTVTLTNGTLDLNSKTLSCGLFSSSNSNTRSIAFGTGNITLTGSNTTVLLLTTSTGLSVTGIKLFNANYSGSTGTRTFAVGSAGSGATEANAVNVSITDGTDIATITSGRVLGSLDFTGFAGTLTNTAYTLYGNLTTSSGMSIDAGASAITFAATSGTKTITTNGKTFDFPMNFTGVGGTWEFADALTQGSTRAFAIANGTVKLKAGATSTVGAFATSGSNQKYLQSTTAGSQATLSQASGTVNASYLTIKDINATGGATWNAYRSLNNIDAGNNTGWDFLSTPVTTTTLAMRLGFGL